MMSLEAQANDLGIPMRIVVDDSLRYRECDAHEAMLASIEGTKAKYKGHCYQGHIYDMEYEIDELKEMMTVNKTTGEIEIGGEKDKMNPLQEM